MKRVAIVTGSSRGMGRDTVLRLAERGISSIITYDTSRDEADDVVTAVQEAGAAAVAPHLDVGQATTFDVFVADVRDALVPFDVKIRRSRQQRRDVLASHDGERDGSGVGRAVCNPLQGTVPADSETAAADE